MSVAGEIGPEETELLSHAGHPSVPDFSGFQITVKQDDGFGVEPRGAEPVLAVEHLKAGRHGDGRPAARAVIPRIRRWLRRRGEGL